MGDADQTIYSSRSGVTQPEKPKRNPLLIIGGIGCVLLLCAGLLIAGAAYFLRDQISSLAGLPGAESTPTVEAPTDEPTPTPIPEPTEEVAATSESDAPATTEASAGSEATPEVSGEPEIGEIIFALGSTENQEPVDPADTFEEGITEVHAIFEHSNILPDYTWERVWYLNGEEVLRSEETWGSEPTGVFDYFINAGGDPLSPGEWVLELYVEGELLASGSFVIEAAVEETAAITPTDTPTPETAAETPTPTATRKPAAPPAAKTYQLVYTKWDGGRHVIFIGNTDGSAEQFILHNGAGPSWSRDGSHIFFFGEPGVNIQNRDAFPGVGSCELPGISDGIVAITVPPAPFDVCQAQNIVVEQGPGWNDGTARWTSVSPDGSMVAYDARPGGDYRIYFLGTADNQQFKYEIVGEQADWSPDSQKVVYRSGRDGKTGIWISNRDDSGHTLITNGNDSFPAWSPDGKTIAFSRDEGGNVDIYTVNVDGSNLTRLTDMAGPDTLPIYTPGGQIIFRSARSGAWGIWKMNSDGSDQKEIIPNAGVGPDWAKSKMDVR
jgi:hypothetical protein